MKWENRGHEFDQTFQQMMLKKVLQFVFKSSDGIYTA